MEKRSEDNTTLDTIETNDITDDKEEQPTNAEDKSKSSMDDLNMLAKLFPKFDRTTLIDNLLACNGNTVEAIHKLLTANKPTNTAIGSYYWPITHTSAKILDNTYDDDY